MASAGTPTTNNANFSSQNEIAMLERWDPMGEHFYSTHNTTALDPDKEPECLVTGRMMNEVLKVGKHPVCNHFLKYGTCADDTYCDRLHIDPSARSGIHSLQRDYEMNTGKTRLVSSFLSPIELTPNVDVLILVSITMIKSPCMFYFVAPYEQMNFAGHLKDEIDFYIGRVKNSSIIKTKLQKCHEQLACLFDHNYRVDNPKSIICNCQIVACKLDDGRFCRAMVVDNRIDDDQFERLYTLFLIDVGIEVKLPRESLYEIRASCLTEPPMAIMARLDVKPAGGELNWHPETLSTFKKLATGEKYLFCRVKSYWKQDDIFTVDLLRIDDRTSVTEVLLRNGLAERSTL